MDVDIYKASVYFSILALALMAGLSQLSAATHIEGVCYQRSSRYVTTYSRTSSSYTTSYSCGLFWWSRCRRSHTRYSQISQPTIIYYSATRCCGGFTNTGNNVCLPVCNQGCYNGGTCTDPGVCTCDPSWTGDDCQTPICSQGCYNGGTCTYPGVCNCTSSWTGNDCQTPVCNQGCYNGGTCTDPGVCTCTSSWTGNDCQTPVCIQGCYNGGLCTDPGVCTCTSSWTGNDCQTPVCNQGCYNGGTCTDPDVCTCTSSWTGNDCQTPVCNQGCHNGGTCTDPGVCTCTSSWTGNDCQTPVCNHGCYNGGTCTDPGVCTCTSSWTGNDCQTPVCNQSCHNGGTCTDPGVCTCDPYWTGDDCTTSVDECAENTHSCEQNCFDIELGFNCDCQTGYRLNSDHRSCSEIDECAEDTDGCGHNCLNNIGSYECSCDTGYRMDEDRHTCHLEPPAAPLNVIVTEVTATSVHLEWSSPQYGAYGIAINYTIRCAEDDQPMWLSTELNTSETEFVTDLEPLTNYTCCVSASNQAGEGDGVCVTALTLDLPVVDSHKADESLKIGLSVFGGLIIALLGVVMIATAYLRNRKISRQKRQVSTFRQTIIESMSDIPKDEPELKNRDEKNEIELKNRDNKDEIELEQINTTPSKLAPEIALTVSKHTKAEENRYQNPDTVSTKTVPEVTNKSETGQPLHSQPPHQTSEKKINPQMPPNIYETPVLYMNQNVVKEANEPTLGSSSQGYELTTGATPYDDDLYEQLSLASSQELRSGASPHDELYEQIPGDGDPQDEELYATIDY